MKQGKYFNPRFELSYSLKNKLSHSFSLCSSFYSLLIIWSSVKLTWIILAWKESNNDDKCMATACNFFFIFFSFLKNNSLTINNVTLLILW